jgi:DNA-binding MarR family transcriptional regulator
MDIDVGHDVAEALGDLLRRDLRANLYQVLTEGLGPAVDETTYPVLSGLARTGPRSSAALAVDVGVDRSRVSRHASRLEEAGLVRREPDPADRRSVLLALTDEGERFVAVMRERLAGRIGEALGSWPPEQARAFARDLRRFVDSGPFAPTPAD